MSCQRMEEWIGKKGKKELDEQYNYFWNHIGIWGKKDEEKLLKYMEVNKYEGLNEKI